MATNLHIDEKLLAKAVRMSGKKSKRETVNEALEEYVRYREQLKFLDLAGTLDDADFWESPTPGRRPARSARNGKSR